MKKNMQYHSVFSDLDNTLLMPDKTLSPKTREILEKITNLGIVVVPSTGRAFWSMPEDILNFSGFQYAIVSNGAAIYDMKTKKPLISLTLQEDFAGKLFKFLRDRGDYVTYECFVEGQAYTSEYYFNDPADFGIPGDRERDYVQGTRIAVPDIEEFILEHAGQLDALDVIILPKDRERLARAIADEFEGVYITTSVEHLIEISNENSGKDKAMAALIAHLGLTKEGTIAFGDGNNDHEMLRAAGLGVAVENASDICKASADCVIGPFEKESIADFLEDIFVSSNEL